MPQPGEGRPAGSGGCQPLGRTPTTAAPWLLRVVPMQEGSVASTVLHRQDVCIPGGTLEGCVPSHPGHSTESLLSDGAKKFKACGNGDPPHKAGGRWLQMYGEHGQQEPCPLQTGLAGRPKR